MFEGTVCMTFRKTQTPLLWSVCLCSHALAIVLSNSKELRLYPSGVSDFVFCLYESSVFVQQFKFNIDTTDLYSSQFLSVVILKRFCTFY